MNNNCPFCIGRQTSTCEDLTSLDNKLEHHNQHHTPLQPKGTEDWETNFFDNIFPCINKGCNGSGVIAVQLKDGDWEPEQCEFCYVVRFKVRGFIHSIESQALERGRREEKESKDCAYRERDMLVCALSKVFPAYLARHDEKDLEWENDWRWIVYIDLPTGQVSWHIHDSEREMFNHLEVKENNWDGHNTERKYQRLQALALLSPQPTNNQTQDK